MCNCKTAHPDRSHRRRNRFLRKTIEPLHWFSDPRALSGEWGGASMIELPERPKRSSRGLGSVITDFLGMGQGSSAPPEKSEPLVKVYQPSALRRLATSAKRFMPFTRKSG